MKLLYLVEILPKFPLKGDTALLRRIARAKENIKWNYVACLKIRKKTSSWNVIVFVNECFNLNVHKKPLQLGTTPRIPKQNIFSKFVIKVKGKQTHKF